jgi:hypothetical protein
MFTSGGSRTHKQTSTYDGANSKGHKASGTKRSL